jgi:hypothetical protein
VKRAGLLAVACLAIAACGSSKSLSDGAAGASGSGGGGGGGGTGGAGGAIGDPVCAFAVATQPCSSEGTVCGAAHCVDQCQFCNLLRCMNGVWQPMEVAPYPCFSCGPDLRCRQSLDYCYVVPGAAPPGTTTHNCAPVPTVCLPTPTCDCLHGLGAITVGSICEQAGAGELTVTLDVL